MDLQGDAQQPLLAKGAPHQRRAHLRSCLIAATYLFLVLCGVVAAAGGHWQHDKGSSQLGSDASAGVDWSEDVGLYESTNLLGFKSSLLEIRAVEGFPVDLHGVAAVGSDKFVVAIAQTGGNASLQRRAPDQPFLTLGEGVTLAAAGPINTVAQAVEAVLGRRLFPIRLEAADFNTAEGTEGSRLCCVWDVAGGRVLLDRRTFFGPGAGLLSGDRAQGMSALIAEHLVGRVASLLQTAGEGASLLTPAGLLPGLLAPAVAMAVPAAFAAVPLWFCVLCPALLGLLAPLVINEVLGQAAAHLCDVMQLPDDTCYDLMLGALALAYVLSLVSAIPIFYVCKLRECTHGGPSPPSGGIAIGRRAGGSALMQTMLHGWRWPRQ